jgi:heme-degrading monooxygenase HmoA
VIIQHLFTASLSAAFSLHVCADSIDCGILQRAFIDFSSVKEKGTAMIARIWRGVTPAEKAEQYLDYLLKTGLKDYRATPGNQGVQVLQRTYENKTEFLLISSWESYAAIHAFAGDDIEKAVYYPEDEAFLLELEPTVKHYESAIQL